MTIPSILAATWSDGVFVFTGGTRRQELAGRVVRALAPDQNGGALAIVDKHSLCRRTGEGVWSTIATSQLDLMPGGSRPCDLSRDGRCACPPCQRKWRD